MPLARQVVRDLAVEHGACIRPVQLRRTNLDTGEVDQVLVPCGHTLASVCPSCAERARSLRAAQCREGWHLEDEPDHRPPTRPPRTSSGGSSSAPRPSSTATRPRRPGRTPPTWTSSSPSWTRRSPRRACAGRCTRPGRRGGTAPPGAARTPRTCPAARSSPRTVGKTYTAPDGKTFRPSMFVTLTCPSYGRVGEDGTPADPAAYDYDRAARDALTSPRCSTGSSRTCAASSATTCSTSPPSNRSGASPRTSTSRCAAPCPAPSCARCSPPPTTRSGGQHDHRSSTTGTSCRSGTRPPATISTRPPGKSCRPGTRPSTPSGTRTSRGMWPGSGTGSTPRACCPDPRTPAGASAT